MYEEKDYSRQISETFKFRKEKQYKNNEVIGLESKRELFAKEVVKNLFESFIYNEDFDINEEEKSSTLFADFVLNRSNISNIVKSTTTSFPSSLTESVIKDLAKEASDTLIKAWIEDGRFQMIEMEEFINRLSENNKEINKDILMKKFPLFREFDYLANVKKSDDCSLTEALINEMTDLERSKLALRINGFKGALNSIGVDVGKESISKRIDEEFEKNLFI